MALKFKDREELKPVLGAYAAMARNNAYIIISGIMHQLQIAQPDLVDPASPEMILDKEAHMDKLNLFPQNSTLKPEIKDSALGLICSHFPFLQAEGDLSKGDSYQDINKLSPRTYEEKCRTLLDAISMLTYIRDANLHYRFNDNRIDSYHFRIIESNTGHLLRLVLKASLGKVYDRYKGTGLVSQGTLCFFREDQYIKEEDAYHFNYDWRFSPQMAPSPIKGDDRELSRLSTFGEILLVALFTEKRYIYDFLQSCGLLTLNGFSKKTMQSGTMSQQRLIKTIVAAYSVSIPRRFRNIRIDENEVIKSIVSDLSKCPAVLYPVLPEAKKRIIESEAIDGTPLVAKRFNDRFASSLLKFIDTNKLFESIRFHVYFGKLRFLFHDYKEYMDGIERQRFVQDALHSFGRIQEIEELRKSSESFQGIKISRQTDVGDQMPLPFIVDSRPRYIINKDSVGLSIHGEDFPVITNENGRYKVRQPRPDCWISLYELPALGFYLYLERKYNLSLRTEQIILNKVNEYRKFFKGVADGSITSMKGVDIPEKAIPRKILDYLKGNNERSDYREYKDTIVNTMVSETELRLKRFRKDIEKINNGESKIGRKTCPRILPGRLAAFLAKDIVFFQSYPAGHPEMRLTTQQFCILRGLLATFPPDVEDCCRRAGLLSGKTSHPFLQMVFNAIPKEDRDTLTFYETYLEKKIYYLKNNIPDNAPFLHPGKAKWQNKDANYYRAMAQRYLNGREDDSTPGIFLPRGLFDKAISNTLSERCPDCWEVIRRVNHANTAFMILTYLEEELKDNAQWFYYDENRLNEYNFAKLIFTQNTVRRGRRDLEEIVDEEMKNNTYYSEELDRRVYELERLPKSKLRRNRMSFDDLKVELRSSYKQMCDNEKAIRRAMVQDIVLFLLIRRFLNEPEKSYLRNIGKGDGSLMNQRVTVTTLYNDHYQICQTNTRVKDLGALYRVLNDKRIDSLLEQAGIKDNETIELDCLADELRQYDALRVPIVAMILEYEKGVYDAHPELEAKTGRIDFRTILKFDDVSSVQEKEALRAVRNAFSHNAYPNRIVKTEGEDDFELYETLLPGMADSISLSLRKLVNGVKGTE